MNAPYPIEKIIYEEDVWDEPCDAWGIHACEGEKAIRYLRADLTCGECANADFEEDEEEAPCMAGERAEVQCDTTACMAFKKRENSAPNNE